MIEKEYKLSKSNEKAIEKVIFDENLHYLHMVFNKGEGLPIESLPRMTVIYTFELDKCSGSPSPLLNTM